MKTLTAIHFSAPERAHVLTAISDFLNDDISNHNYTSKWFDRAAHIESDLHNIAPVIVYDTFTLDVILGALELYYSKTLRAAFSEDIEHDENTLKTLTEILDLRKAIWTETLKMESGEE